MQHAEPNQKAKGRLCGRMNVQPLIGIDMSLFRWLGYGTWPTKLVMLVQMFP